MIITEIPHFSSKIIRFQVTLKSAVEFTCALEFKISSQLLKTSFPLFHTGKVFHQYIFHILIPSGISIFDTDEFKAMFPANLIFLSVALHHNTFFLVFSPIQFDCKDWQVYFCPWLPLINYKIKPTCVKQIIIIAVILKYM